MGVDNNKVRFTGENSFLRLGMAEGEPSTASNSHWRSNLSPKGSGHALFTMGDHTEGLPRIYADNIALARWLQEGIMASMTSDFTGPEIPIIQAEFWKEGDTLTYWSEYIQSDHDDIVLTWYDFMEPFAMANKPFENKPSQPHGLYNVLVPARRAQMTVNGIAIPGKSLPRKIGTADGTTCCLALSETWLIPRDHGWAKE
ncbi:MAG: hypothetical protein FJ319_14505 [SAR202 cluster bacterium]|nr:hypothetical protein [SAR202 cluster bacterium]